MWPGRARHFSGSMAPCYVVGNALKVWGWPVELSLLMGLVAGAGLGLVMGGLAIRRQGIYFSMITLALAQMVFFIALRAGEFTGGEDGLQGVPRGSVLGMVDLGS